MRERTNVVKAKAESLWRKDVSFRGTEFVEFHAYPRGAGLPNLRWLKSRKFGISTRLPSSERAPGDGDGQEKV